MSLIPQIELEKLVEKIKSGDDVPSVEVFHNDKYIGTFIVPAEIGGFTIYHEIKTEAEYLGVRGNIVVPPKVFEGLKEEPVVNILYPNLVKAREARRLKQEASAVGV